MPAAEAPLKPLAEMTDEEIAEVQDFSPYLESMRFERGRSALVLGLRRALDEDLRSRFRTPEETNAALRRLLELEPDFGKS